MTRQWLAPPSMMCLNHRMGEHFEAHVFLRKMQKGHSLKGFRDGSMFFGATFIKYRHDLLAKDFKGHKSPLKLDIDVVEKYPFIVPTVDDISKSLTDLIERCPSCVKVTSNFLTDSST